MKETLNLIEDLKYSNFIKDISSPEKFDTFIVNNNKIKAYCGFDLTAKSLQLGNLIPILNLRKILKHGGKIIILLGNATTKIGDPSGRDDIRKMLTEEQIQENKKSILYCIGKFIDLKNENVEIVENFEWFKDKNYIDFLKEIGIHFTINKMINIDIVKQRLEKQLPMTFLEFNYMIMQGYDFYYLYKNYNCNLQIGGSDQWGNIIQGIELIKHIQSSEKKDNKETSEEVFAYTIPLLLKSDGTKMGKTAGGAVWLHEEFFSSFDYFQYFRNTSDDDVIRFLKIFTDLSPLEIAKYENFKNENLNEVKDILAFEAVKMRDGEVVAFECLEKSQKLFSKKEFNINEIEDKDIIFISNDEDLLNLIIQTGACDSKSKARNLIISGAVKINDEKIVDWNFKIKKENYQNKFTLKIGKNKIYIIGFK